MIMCGRTSRKILLVKIAINYKLIYIIMQPHSERVIHVTFDGTHHNIDIVRTDTIDAEIDAELDAEADQ